MNKIEERVGYGTWQLSDTTMNIYGWHTYTHIPYHFSDCLCVISSVRNGIIVMKTTSRQQIKIGKMYQFFSLSVTKDLCLKIVCT